MAWILNDHKEEKTFRISDETMETALLRSQLMTTFCLDAVETELFDVEYGPTDEGGPNVRQTTWRLDCEVMRKAPDYPGSFRVDRRGATLLIDEAPRARLEWRDLIASFVDPTKRRVYQHIFDNKICAEPIFGTDEHGRTVVESMLTDERCAMEPEHFGLDESGLPSLEAATDSPSP